MTEPKLNRALLQGGPALAPDILLCREGHQRSRGHTWMEGGGETCYNFTPGGNSDHLTSKRPPISEILRCCPGPSG